MSNDQRLPRDSSRISSFLEIWFISMRNENTENLRSFAQLGSSQNITLLFENWQVWQIFCKLRKMRYGFLDYG